MASFNSVTLVGNLTRDPELRFTPKGAAVAKLGLAVNRTWTTEGGEKKEEVSFIDCEAWGKTAENIAQYHKKGSPIMLQGRLKMDTWDDKQTGQKKSRLMVVVETAVFIAPRSGEAAPAATRSETAPQGSDDEESIPF